MALDAGLKSPAAVSRIINDNVGARPETLKALTDRWGTPEDYVEMMRLAGHPMPAPRYPLPGGEEIETLLSYFEQLNLNDQRRILIFVEALYWDQLEEERRDKKNATKQPPRSAPG